MKRIAWAAAFTAVAAMGCTTSAEDKPGYTDTPMLPGGEWRVHDPDRPYPEVVTPGEAPGAPPSDAIVLFDGTGLDDQHACSALAARVADALGLSFSGPEAPQVQLAQYLPQSAGADEAPGADRVGVDGNPHGAGNSARASPACSFGWRPVCYF